MASPNYYCFPLILFLATSSFFINPTLCVDEATQHRIDSICRKMEVYGFCNDVFTENIYSPLAEFEDLTRIAIVQATDNATRTHAFILGLLEKEKDPAEKNALVTCENAYGLVIDAFSKAAVEFFEKNYDSMLKSVRPAARAQDSCTTIFSIPPNPPDPIGNRNMQMRILIAMAFAAGNLLLN